VPFEYDILIPPGKKRERLDLFLTHHIENATRNKVQQAIREGMVLVNGKEARASHLVSPGEVVHITLPKPPPQKAVPEDIPLEMAYEDDFLLVVNKRAGMVTHPAHGNYSGTLVNALLYHCRSLASAGDVTRPGIVHRLDKDTSGLLVIAKTDAVHASLAQQFSARTVDREYQAVVWGVFRKPKGDIDAQLGRSRSDRKRMSVIEGGKHAVTQYSVIRQYPYLCLLSLRLLTGRTHQIRVHLAHIGHPVFGDPTYGGRRIVTGTGSPRQRDEVHRLLGMMPRQALHAKTLGFLHPATNKRVFFTSDLPADMTALLETLDMPPAMTEA
jgi:23S rRNA pseudouridine1911/1915/1917 synthase